MKEKTNEDQELQKVAQEELSPVEREVYERIAPIITSNNLSLLKQIGEGYVLQTQKGGKFMEGLSLGELDEQIQERRKLVTKMTGYAKAKGYSAYTQSTGVWRICRANLDTSGVARTVSDPGYPLLFEGSPIEAWEWLQSAPDFTSKELNFRKKIDFVLGDEQCEYIEGNAGQLAKEAAQVWLQREGGTKFLVKAEGVLRPRAPRPDGFTNIIRIVSTDGVEKASQTLMDPSMYVVDFGSVELEKGDCLVFECIQPSLSRHFIVKKPIFY